MLDEIGPHRVTFVRSLTPNANRSYMAAFGLVNSETVYNDLLLREVLKNTVYASLRDSDHLYDTLNLCIFEEAFRLGNNGDPNASITIQTYNGRGSVFRIEHQGRFDYRERIAHVRNLVAEKGDARVNEENYEDPHVMAILLLDDPGIKASYERGGSIINIKVPDPGPLN